MNNISLHITYTSLGIKQQFTISPTYTCFGTKEQFNSPRNLHICNWFLPFTPLRAVLGVRQYLRVSLSDQLWNFTSHGTPHWGSTVGESAEPGSLFMPDQWVALIPTPVIPTSTNAWVILSLVGGTNDHSLTTPLEQFPQERGKERPPCLCLTRSLSWVSGFEAPGVTLGPWLRIYGEGY